MEPLPATGRVGQYGMTSNQDVSLWRRSPLTIWFLAIVAFDAIMLIPAMGIVATGNDPAGNGWLAARLCLTRRRGAGAADAVWSDRLVSGGCRPSLADRSVGDALGVELGEGGSYLVGAGLVVEIDRDADPAVQGGVVPVICGW